MTSKPPARADVFLVTAIHSGEGDWLPEEAKARGQDLSRSQIQRLIQDGHVRIDGERVRASSLLQPGMKVELELPAPKPLDLVPEDRPLEILFEDDHLLVLNKPQGLTVHPSPTQTEGTLVHALLFHIRHLSGIGGKLRPGIVHRLDKDTSGALVITKTDEAHHALAQVFAKHDIERAYWALCYGAPAQPGPLRIESRIGRNPSDRKKMAMDVKDGRVAITHVRRLEEFSQGRAPFASLLEARLETGRTHQVRVHLTGLGHSVLGDPVYGIPSQRSTKWLALPEEIRDQVTLLSGQALHARILGFKHPLTGQPLRFEAPLPSAFANLLRALEPYRATRKD